MFKCLNCGEEIKLKDKYCRNCGIEIHHSKVKEMAEYTDANNLMQKYKQNFNRKTNKIKKGVVSKDTCFAFSDCKVILIPIAIIILSLMALVIKTNYYDSKDYFEVNVNESVTQSGRLTYYTYSIYEPLFKKSFGGLNKIRDDEKESVKISNDFGNYLNVKGDWIFYCSANDNMKIYKIKNDGTERQKISNDNAYYLTMVGDYLYYKDSSITGNFFRINVKTNNKEKISDDVLSFCFDDGHIYYASVSILGKIYKMNLDGTEIKELLTIEGPLLLVNNNYIYYMDIGIESKVKSEINIALFLNSTGKVCRINLDGSNKRTIIPFEVHSFIPSQSYFYFQRPGKINSDLYQADYEGKNIKRVLANSRLMGITDKWIYYSDTEIYRMNLHSIEIQKLGSNQEIND